MSDKYVVSQEFMNGLVDWKHDTAPEKDFYITPFDFKEIPFVVKSWWLANNVDSIENNNRLIAILRWVNGEDVFEVEKPKLWVVRSKEPDGDGDYGYVQRNSLFNIGFTDIIPSLTLATKFNSKEEAEHWVGPYQEVIEVEE